MLTCLTSPIQLVCCFFLSVNQHSLTSWMEDVRCPIFTGILGCITGEIYSETSKLHYFIFLQIYKILPTAKGLSISVCACFNFVSSCHSFVKIKKCKNDAYRFWYFSLNGTIANVILCDLDLLLQGQKFKLFKSGNQLTACGKRHHTAIKDFYICYEMASLWKLVYVSLTCFFKVIYLEC